MREGGAFHCVVAYKVDARGSSAPCTGVKGGYMLVLNEMRCFNHKKAWFCEQTRFLFMWNNSHFIDVTRHKRKNDYTVYTVVSCSVQLVQLPFCLIVKRPIKAHVIRRINSETYTNSSAYVPSANRIYDLCCSWPNIDSSLKGWLVCPFQILKLEITPSFQYKSC